MNTFARIALITILAMLSACSSLTTKQHSWEFKAETEHDLVERARCDNDKSEYSLYISGAKENEYSAMRVAHEGAPTLFVYTASPRLFEYPKETLMYLGYKDGKMTHLSTWELVQHMKSVTPNVFNHAFINESSEHDCKVTYRKS